MLVYRVFPHVPGAAEGDPGHPLYLPQAQGSGRLDNPSHYRVWYFALEPSGAVGEKFGNLSTWREEMFFRPDVPGSRLALATYFLPENLDLLNLDDSNALHKRGLRPTQVIERNTSATQAWALSIFLERNSRGERAWSGVRWWSFHRPQWRVIGYWDNSLPKLARLEELDLNHIAVIDAARTLGRPLMSEPVLVGAGAETGSRATSAALIAEEPAGTLATDEALAALREKLSGGRN